MTATTPNRQQETSPDVEERMKAFYNRSEVYRQLLSTPDAFRLSVALQQFVSVVTRHSSADGYLLDLGCGTGETTRGLSEQGRRAIGLDISALLLAPQPQRFTEGSPRYVIGDVVRLPFHDRSLSCVSMHNVIEHVPNTNRLLQEVERVLRPRGSVVIVSPNLLSPLRPVRHILGIEGFDTRFYGSAWKAFLAVFINTWLLTCKALVREPGFTYRMPLLDEEFRCPDDDAVYLSNVIDLRKWFERHGFVAQYLQFMPEKNGIGRLKSLALTYLPWLDKGFCLVAQRG